MISFAKKTAVWRPTAFLFFLLLGGALMALGIGVYLFSLVSAENKPSPE
jgi:hypothetical protein